jgi:hypothetical protein
MRTTTCTITVAVAALALGGCGGGGDPAATPSGADKAFEGALKFARCMRGEGLDFPDPQRQGNGLIKISPPRGQASPDDPKVKAATDKCQKYLQEGGGDSRDPAQEARFQDAFVKYARCMRGEGVNIPDPKPGQGGITFRKGDANAPDPESPAFKAADRTCHHLLAAVDMAISGEQSP